MVSLYHIIKLRWWFYPIVWSSFETMTSFPRLLRLSPAPRSYPTFVAREPSGHRRHAQSGSGRWMAPFLSHAEHETYCDLTTSTTHRNWLMVKWWLKLKACLFVFSDWMHRKCRELKCNQLALNYPKNRLSLGIWKTNSWYFSITHWGLTTEHVDQIMTLFFILVLSRWNIAFDII